MSCCCFAAATARAAGQTVCLGLIAGLVGFLAAAATTAHAAPAPAPAGLAEIEDPAAHFQQAAQDHRRTVRGFILRSFENQKRSLAGRYDKQMAAEEALERERRLSAIALYEQFLLRYPQDASWTPNVIFRLAELYFEKSNDEYHTAAAKLAQGTEPPPNYQKTIELFTRLIREFPGYRHIDGAYYLLGYCLGEQGQEAEALRTYLALVCGNRYSLAALAGAAASPPVPSSAAPLPSPSGPGLAAAPAPSGRPAGDPYKECIPLRTQSRFVPEAWTRIGEHHFDFNELALAIAAYGRVLAYRDSPYFDKALYKLAWSYYRDDKFADGIARFDELVKWSDEHKGSGKEGSDMRPEAIQYLAVSFAERDWNGDQTDDPEQGLARIQRFYAGRDAEPHVREVYQRLGDVYFDDTRYADAIAVYKLALSKWPFAPENPKVQDKIILALERMRNFDDAIREREALAQNFARGTEWYRKNRDNAEALATARDLAEQSLIQAAVFHNNAAIELKKKALAEQSGRLLELAQKEYGLAATAYERYLERYQNTKRSYEYGYFYAECLYYSQRFLDAARQYEKIRDSNIDNKYRDDAAFSAVKSYEEEIKQRVARKELVEPPIPRAGEAQAPVQPLAVPEIYRQLQAAYDTYVSRVKGPRAADLAYAAAMISFRHLQFEEARRRFAEFMEKNCTHEKATEAGNGILTSYTMENDLNKIEEWGKRLAGSACGSQARRAEQAGNIKNLLDDVRFRKAEQLFADAKYEEASQKYIELVDSNPRGANSDKALNNAAVGYENVKRYGAATQIYERIYREYPNSPFADYALFRAAVNYERYFDFGRAVTNYLILVDSTRFANSKHRVDSLYNAAQLLENDQSYGRAAELFKRYADLAPKPAEGAEAYFRAGVIYGKMNAPQQVIRTMRDFIARYGSEPQAGAHIVEAYYRIGEAFEGLRDRASADASYNRAMNEFWMRRLPPAGDAAEPAAHAAFILAERRLEQYQKLRIQGGKQLGRSIEEFSRQALSLENEYRRVFEYKRVTWTLAAFFRSGFVYEHFAKTLLAAPIPKEITRLGPEGEQLYRDQVEKLTSGIEEKAVQKYRDTLARAAEFGVSNEWTKLARARANAYKPDEPAFQIMKDERVEMQLD